MSSRRELSLDNLLREVHALRESIEALFPAYIASLQRLSRVPGEFERRYWAAKIDPLVDRVKGEHDKYQAEVDQANLLGRLMTPLRDAMLRMGRMEPVPPPAPLESCVSISSSGKIELTLRDTPLSRADVVLLTFEEFREVALRLRQMVMEGTVAPKEEDEILKLIYTLSLR